MSEGGESNKHISSIPTIIQSIPALIKDECGGSGSGFFIRHQNCLFLVTASHVLFDGTTQELYCDAISYQVWLGLDDAETGMEIRRVDLEKIDASHIINLPASDIAAIRLGSVNTMTGSAQIAYSEAVQMVKREGTGDLIVADKKSSLGYDDLKIGNEAFTIGYPSSIGLKQSPQLSYERPLLRKGVIAGKNPELRTVILDCPVYQGNSGGPVVEIHRCGDHCKKNHFSLFGVVSQFIPFEENWRNDRFGTVRTEWSNSGYSVVMPLDTLFDKIDEEMSQDETCRT